MNATNKNLFISKLAVKVFFNGYENTVNETSEYFNVSKERAEKVVIHSMNKVIKSNFEKGLVKA